MKRPAFPVILLFIFIISVQPAQAAAKLTANSIWPKENLHSQFLHEYADRVQKATGGSVIIEVKDSNSLQFKGPDLLEAVRDNRVNISDMLITGVEDKEPFFQIITLPFFLKDLTAVQNFDQMARPYFDNYAKKWNQKILYMAPWSAAGLWTKRPILKASDMAGLQTRTYDQNGAKVIELLKGKSHVIPFVDVFKALEDGTIDSAIATSSVATDTKFWQVLKYYNMINIAFPQNMVTINLDVFNKLSAEEQKILVNTADDLEKTFWYKITLVDEMEKNECAKHGMSMPPVSAQLRDELMKETESIRQDWYKTAPPDAQELYMKYMNKYGGPKQPSAASGM